MFQGTVPGQSAEARGMKWSWTRLFRCPQYAQHPPHALTALPHKSASHSQGRPLTFCLRLWLSMTDLRRFHSLPRSVLTQSRRDFRTASAVAGSFLFCPCLNFAWSLTQSRHQDSSPLAFAGLGPKFLRLAASLLLHREQFAYPDLVPATLPLRRLALSRSLRLRHSRHFVDSPPGRFLTGLK